MKKRRYTVTKWVWLPATIICMLCIVRFLIPIFLAFAPHSAFFESVSEYYASSSFNTELCVTIIGTAISVSIGLNIYNTIEKNELNELRLNAQRFETSISRAHEGERITFLNLLLEVHGDAMMEHFFKVFNKKLTDPETSDMLDEYITDLVSIQRTYVLAYNMYNSSPRGKTIESDTLINTINISSAGENKLCHAYVNFVTADMYYFMNQCDNAIDFYKKVINSCSVIDEMQDPIVNIYLYNSIGWSYCKTRKYEKAQQEFKTMEDIIQKSKMNSFKNPYISRFYRNYGVCYENLAMLKGSNNKEELERNLETALSLYDKALKSWDPNSGDYKILITSCSAKMKYWDSKYNKASLNWEVNAQKKPKKDIEDIESIDSVVTIEDIKLSLDIAQKLNPSFSDIYVQRAKVLTYSLLRDNTMDKETKRVIEENIKTAKKLKSSGVKYVVRDYYHALWLLSKNNEEKRYYYDKIVNINQSIDSKNNKEAQSFETLYPPKRHNQEQTKRIPKIH